MMFGVSKLKTMKAILLFIILLAAAGTFSQTNSGNSDNQVAYRIVAYKNIDNSIQSISNIVEVAKKLNIQVPNAFSPDGDGINDEFMIVHEGIEEFSMDIYNRWGELVYHSEDLQAPWTGMYDGSDCQQDAYVYVIKARGLEEETATTLKGTVSLIR